MLEVGYALTNGFYSIEHRLPVHKNTILFVVSLSIIQAATSILYVLKPPSVFEICSRTLVTNTFIFSSTVKNYLQALFFYVAIPILEGGHASTRMFTCDKILMMAGKFKNLGLLAPFKKKTVQE